MRTACAARAHVAIIDHVQTRDDLDGAPALVTVL